jgi:hypothetical protein
MPEREAPEPVLGRHAAPEVDDAPTVHLPEPAPVAAPAAEPAPAPGDAQKPISDPSPTRAEPRTRHSRGARPHSSHRVPRPSRRRLVVTIAVAAAAAGAFFAAWMMTAGSPAPTPTSAPVLPVAAPPIVPSPTTATSSTAGTTTARVATSSTRSSTRATTTAARATRTAADTGPGCGQRAVSRGVFNPACSEYEGYLDPGRAAGRQPSSSDLQHDDGCQKGYIPKSQC